MSRRTLTLALTLASLLTPPALAQGVKSTYSGPKVEITFWNGQSGDNRKYIDDLVKKYNASHANVNVRLTTPPGDTIAQQLPSLVAAGRAPDVTSLIETMTIPNGLRGVIEPLTPAMLKQGGIDQGRFYKSLWAGATYGGKSYGVPVYNVAFAMYYNKDLLKRMGVTTVPATSGEFLKAAQACTTDKAGKHPTEAGFDARNLQTWGVGIPGSFNGGVLAYVATLQNGGNSVDASNNPTFTNAQARAGFQSILDLVSRHHVSPANMTEDSQEAAFRAGKQCFSMTGTWIMVNYQGQKNLNFGVAPLPQLGSKNRSSWGGSGYLVLPKQRGNYDPNKRAAALDFINWFTLPENNLYFNQGGTLPTMPAVAADKSYDGTPLQELFRGLQDVHIEAGFPWVDQVRSAWDNAWDAALSGKKDVQAALKDGEVEATKTVQQARQNFTK